MIEGTPTDRATVECWIAELDQEIARLESERAPVKATLDVKEREAAFEAESWTSLDAYVHGAYPNPTDAMSEWVRGHLEAERSSRKAAGERARLRGVLANIDWAIKGRRDDRARLERLLNGGERKGIITREPAPARRQARVIEFDTITPQRAAAG